MTTPSGWPPGFGASSTPNQPQTHASDWGASASSGQSMGNMQTGGQGGASSYHQASAVNTFADAATSQPSFLPEDSSSSQPSFSITAPSPNPSSSHPSYSNPTQHNDFLAPVRSKTCPFVRNLKSANLLSLSTERNGRHR